METPEQTLFVGQLIRATKDSWPYLKQGDVGLVTLARCDKVCTKGGLIGLSEAEGGPGYSMEWCYVAMFSNNISNPRGVRLSYLSPVEVINENR
jgi:hypothetical protein